MKSGPALTASCAHTKRITDGNFIRLRVHPIQWRRGCHSKFPLRVDENRRAGLDEFEKILGVPVRQAEAAVRFGAADLIGTRGAVDALVGFVEGDPRATCWVVWAGRDDQFAFDRLGFRRFGKNGWVKSVVWILGAGDDGELADGTFFDARGDRAGEV